MIHVDHGVQITQKPINLFALLIEIASEGSGHCDHSKNEYKIQHRVQSSKSKNVPVIYFGFFFVFFCFLWGWEVGGWGSQILGLAIPLLKKCLRVCVFLGFKY